MVDVCKEFNKIIAIGNEYEKNFVFSLLDLNEMIIKIKQCNSMFHCCHSHLCAIVRPKAYNIDPLLLLILIHNEIKQ